MDHSSVKLINLRAQVEQMLHNAVLITEMAMDLKERSTSGEKYVCYLRSLAVRAARVITAMQNSSRSFLLLAQKLVISALKNMDITPANDPSLYSLRLEYEKLLTILERELMAIEDFETAEVQFSNDLINVNAQMISDKIKYLEAKQKVSENAFMPPTGSTKNVKPEVDEKYPESWSRESLIDLNNVMNLPPVPEDIFTSFTKPVRSSSLSSLKGLRKVKLFLHRAENSEDDAESECEEQDILVADEPSKSDSEMKNSPTKKSALLGNIKEESQME